MTKEIIRKIEIILIIFAILITGVSIRSLAAENNYTCTLTVKPDKTQIKAGESVTLSVNVSDIDAGDGIAIFNTTLEYDANIFDLKAQSDSAGNWTSTVLENSITFTKANYEATSEDQEIGKVILTAKQDATLGEKTIAFTKNEFSNTSTFSVADVSTTIEIVEDTGDDNPDDPNNPDDPSNPGDDNNPNDPDDNNNTVGGNNNTSSGGNNNTPSGGNNTGKPSGGSNSVNYSSSGVVNSGKSDNILPKTGTLQNCLISAIVIAVMVAICFYIKYRRAY